MYLLYTIGNCQLERAVHPGQVQHFAFVALQRFPVEAYVKVVTDALEGL